ncbi:MAG: iron-containing alcohol dehydrogenase [Sandaracinaceae bacterium]|nr:iron-containing alcohol dehydrogenase [Sandaracinaceae bacterium]MBK7777653.1 iron-containing alcohol dehydrogenase [Sandaracinaceae bacterium]MBK8410665.1 iron-containing alcohol dehydrogenase [Sandaracinaceae bacterium]MBP7685934.1 iron-containing alcohol dehydrogenase [Deltaproteobacteria bacterium]
MSESFFEFFCPVKIVAGSAALEHVPYELASIGATKPLIITDKGVRAAGLVDVVLGAMLNAAVEYPPVYDDVPPDSSTDVVTDIARVYRSRGCDSLIALGGGSVIDTAKAVNVLVSEGGDDLHAYSGTGVVKRRLRPLFVLPTTSGTGSEATSVAVIRDSKTGAKLPFMSPFLMPDAAVLDPRLTLGLPPFFTAATGMDAMTHAVEAYLCLAKNPLSDAYATAAIRKISEHLVPLLDDMKNPTRRLEVALGATMAGVAFSNSMVGLVHSLGHSVGALCHVPHGVCMSVFLPYVLEYNLDTRRDAIGELLLPLAGAEVFAKTPASERAAAAIQHLRGMRDALHQKAGLPRTLSETGKVARAQLTEIAQLAIDDGTLIMNPREVRYEDALAVLTRAFE